jgi:hypothetical protein
MHEQRRGVGFRGIVTAALGGDMPNTFPLFQPLYGMTQAECRNFAIEVSFDRRN